MHTGDNFCIVRIARIFREGRLMDRQGRER
jgi:hypothetical protein